MSSVLDLTGLTQEQIHDVRLLIRATKLGLMPDLAELANIDPLGTIGVARIRLAEAS